MLTWCIFGHGLPDLKIRAQTFDEALAKARLYDSNYCGGSVIDEDGARVYSDNYSLKRRGKEKTMLQNPCKECAERKVGCHTECIQHKQYLDEFRREKEYNARNSCIIHNSDFGCAIKHGGKLMHVKTERG